MAANIELQQTNELTTLRGFSNLYHKEHRAWWSTRRWWLNALLWMVFLGGLTALMLFGADDEVSNATAAEITQAGGTVGFILALGLNIFFEAGVPLLAIGTVVLAQGAIIGERQSGVAEWLLSKPVTRRAYVLAKVSANALAVVSLMVVLPSLIVYGLLSLRLGATFPVLPFLAAVGIMALHTLFYLTLTLMLGTIFSSRGPIVGIALASILGGGLFGSAISSLYYVTPWMLPNVAMSTATGLALPAGLGLSAVLTTALWCVLFVVVAVKKLEKTEY